MAISGSHSGDFVKDELDDEVPSLPLQLDGLFPGRETLFCFFPMSEVL